STFSVKATLKTCPALSPWLRIVAHPLAFPRDLAAGSSSSRNRGPIYAGASAARPKGCPTRSLLPMKRGFLYAGLVIAAASFVASTAVVLLEWRARETGTPGMTTAADIGGPFSLVDQDGKKVTDADYAGQWKLVFFGFTFCPEVCPTTLNRISLTLKA